MHAVVHLWYLFTHSFVRVGDKTLVECLPVVAADMQSQFALLLFRKPAI